MSMSYDWRGDVGDVWAEEWRRTDRTLAPANDALVAEVGALATPDMRVLDIGCGGGATSLALAEAFPDADITGVDLSESLVELARARSQANPRLHFEVGDAATWMPSEAGFEPDRVATWGDVLRRSGRRLQAHPVARPSPAQG